ncbi:MAG: hypothetical protein IKU83_05730 [Lachnospiraceae bacterium]|nr:hypothetical protein [Lachnospiraceae bacterium]
MKGIQKIAALVLAAALTIGAFAGCASGPKVSNEELASMTVATYGDKEITAGEANFYLRSLQYMYEVYYGSYYGAGMWEMETSGKSMADSVREIILSEVYQIYVLNEKAAELGIALSDEDLAKVEAAVEDYLETAPKEVAEQVCLEKAALTEIYKRNALANRAWEYAVKDTNTEVSDDEAKQRQVTIITLYEVAEDYKAEELKDEILKALKDGKTMEEIAKEKEVAASPYHMGEGDYEDSFGATAMALKEGEYAAEYIENYKAWAIMYCDSEFDKEATDDKKEVIVAERKAAEFESVYKEWKKDAKEYIVDEEVVKLLTFEKPVYVAPTQEPTTAAK